MPNYLQTGVWEANMFAYQQVRSLQMILYHVAQVRTDSKSDYDRQ